MLKQASNQSKQLALIPRGMQDLNVMENDSYKGKTMLRSYITATVQLSSIFLLSSLSDGLKNTKQFTIRKVKSNHDICFNSLRSY